MLPDIRAVIAAMVAAVGLLMATFGVVATLRVAQQHQSESLRADLAARGRSAPPAQSGTRTVLIVDTPGPHLATPVSGATPARAPAVDPAPEPATPVPAIAVQAVPLEPPLAASPPVEVPPQTPPADTPQPVEAAQATLTPPAETTQAAPPAPPPAEIAQAAPPATSLAEDRQAAPPAEPPMGGPLAEPPRRQAETSRGDARDNPSSAKRAAAERARKARAARIARERKAAKRAAQARRAKQPGPAPGGSNTFGNINQVGGTFRQ
jgi:hypothetical protein